MFIVLLLVNFAVALCVCFVIVKVFRSPISKILQRLITDDIYQVWSKYITFAIYVVGISGGVRVFDLERYISPGREGEGLLELTRDRWILEVYRTVIGTLQSNAWMLLVFFIFALIAYVVVRGMEMKKQTP